MSIILETNRFYLRDDFTGDQLEAILADVDTAQYISARSLKGGNILLQYQEYEYGLWIVVMTDPDYRKRGFGTEMMKFLLNRSKKKGITWQHFKHLLSAKICINGLAFNLFAVS